MVAAVLGTLAAGLLSIGPVAAGLREGRPLAGVAIATVWWILATGLIWDLCGRTALYRLVVDPGGSVRAGTPLRTRTWPAGSQVSAAARRRWWLTSPRRRWVQDLIVVAPGARPFRHRLPGGDLIRLLSEDEVEALILIIRTGPGFASGEHVGWAEAGGLASGASAQRAEIGRLAAAIRAEMRRIGMWRDGEPPIDPGSITTAFGLGQMPLERWLQGVFVPALLEAAAGTRPIPDGSQVSVQAVRTWHSPQAARAGVGPLLALLAQVDRVVRAAPGSHARPPS